MFLRVLIHLSMHEYAPLVTGSLQLLLRHFGQRQEVLQAFKQVKLHNNLQFITSRMCVEVLQSCNEAPSLESSALWLEVFQ